MMVKCLTLSLLCIGLAGCLNRSEPLKVWVADEMTRLTVQTPHTGSSDVWDAATRTVRLFSAANETVSFQVVIDAPAGTTGKIGVRPGWLIGQRKGRIAPRNIKLFKMLPVKVERFPAWYLRMAPGPIRPVSIYDILVPAEMLPLGLFDVPSSGRLAIWVDVKVPRDASPGNYTGLIKVQNGSNAYNLKISLRVYDFVLPDMKPVVCIGGFSHETVFQQFVRSDKQTGRTVLPMRLDPTNPSVRKMLIVIRRLMRLAHRHRLDLFDKTIHPILKRDMFGKVVLDWGDYDDIITPYLNGSAFEDHIGVPAWPLPWWLKGASGWPRPADYNGVSSKSYRQTVSAVLSESIRHFDALGFSRGVFVWPGRDLLSENACEEELVRAYRGFIDLARLARTVGASLPILSQFPPRYASPGNMEIPEQYDHLAGMYAPAGNMVDLARYASSKVSGKTTLSGLWLRPGVLPYVGSFDLLAEPADIRVLPWIAMKYNCSGIFIPEVLNWSIGGGNFSQAGGGCLFYPAGQGGQDTVLPSVRLKRLRRGLQDAGYVWLLKQRGRAAIADALVNSIVHYAGIDASDSAVFQARFDGWMRDGRLWSRMRKILAEEVLSAVHPERYNAREVLARQVAWKQFQRQACKVRVEQVIARVDRTPGGQFHTDITVTIYNELTYQADVEVGIKTLPQGWQGLTARVKSTVPTGQRINVKLSARGPSIPTGPDAKMNIPLEMNVNVGQQVDTINAPVPWIVAGMFKGRITIDADLSDWPLRVGNSAGNFVSLGKRGQGGKGLARRQTIAFVLCDGKKLYIAFRCDEPAPDKIKARSDNIIRYDQLLARGEDLVEVIFDPGRTARSPADLYHIIVKCNGVVVAERGIRAFRGKVSPWPARVESAVRRAKGLWVVEMAIPLEAFGAKGKSSTWGVNFTRFSTIDKEASSWTGCKGYFYDVNELGTLFISPAMQHIKMTR